jgi:hypothetical protein
MAMYSGRATDAAKVATFRKTLAAFAIDIGVFCMCIVAFLVGATKLVILTTCPRSRDEIGSGPWTKKKGSGFLSNQESPALFQTSLVCSYCSLFVFVFFVLVFFATKTW